MSKEQQRDSSSEANKEKDVADEMRNNKKVGTPKDEQQQQEFCRCCNSINCVERMKMLLDRELEQRQLQVKLFYRE